MALGDYCGADRHCGRFTGTVVLAGAGDDVTDLQLAFLIFVIAFLVAFGYAVR